MKKTELAEFKREYESAVRDVDKIINNPWREAEKKVKGKKSIIEIERITGTNAGRFVELQRFW